MPILDTHNKLKKKLPKAPSGPLNAAQIGGSARGDDYAPAFNATGGPAILKKTKGSMTQATDILAGKQTIKGAISQNRAIEQERQRQIKEAITKKQKETRQKRQERMKGGRLQTDNMRASNINTTLGEAVTAKGARSTRGISDKEVDDLAKRGFREGDFVPDRGVLLPDGTFDTSRLDKINEIKSKADLIVEQFNKFKEREALKTDNATVSDTPIVQNEKKATDSIANAFKTNPMAESLALLDENILNIKEQLKGDLQSINQSFSQAKTGLEGKQAGEMGAQSVQLANAGGYLGYSGGAQGVLLNLAESHRAELSALDVKRQQAIQEARNAAANRQFDVVREKAKIVEDIEKAAYQSQLDYQEKVALEAEKQAQIAEKQKVEQDIFTAIQGGAKTPADIYKAMGGTATAEEVNSFLKNILPDSLKETGAGFKFSANNTASLLGAGLGQDDILTLNEYINENGYTDELRNQLTPIQRTAADKIFRPIEKVTGKSSSVSFGKPMTVLDLDRIEESYGVRLPFGITQAEATQFFQDNQGKSPDELQAALNKELGITARGNTIDFNADYIRNNLTQDQQKSLADLVGASSWWRGKEADIENMLNNPSFIETLNSKIELLRQQGIADEDIIDALTS